MQNASGVPGGTQDSPKKVFLKSPKAHTRPGHPWFYRSQLTGLEALTPGELVDLYAAKGRYLGRGYCNPRSEITIRLLSGHPETIDAGYFRERILRAALYRKEVVKETNAYRLLSSEADGLPGLIVDVYGGVLVVQFLTLGMDLRRDAVLEALASVHPEKAIYERSDSGSRRLEGLPERTGWIRPGDLEETEVVERDARFLVRFQDGHKTGFYLDQRDNRLALRDFGIKGEVLDGFCHTGAFSVHLALSGCRVLGLEIQPEAVRLAQENVRLNGLDPDRARFRTANVFDELRVLEKERARYDLVILDPPSFVKKRDALEGALAGMKEILLRSMKILKEGGWLAAFSCSYHLDESLLLDAATAAAWDTHKTLRVVRAFRQSADHPSDPFIPETSYLKGYLFHVRGQDR